MIQITIDEFVEVESPKRLICCSMTKNFHWLRISKGDTPADFKKCIDFTLREFEYLYIDTESKDAILAMFEGAVSHVPFNFGKGSD